MKRKRLHFQAATIVIQSRVDTNHQSRRIPLSSVAGANQRRIEVFTAEGNDGYCSCKAARRTLSETVCAINNPRSATPECTTNRLRMFSRPVANAGDALLAPIMQVLITHRSSFSPRWRSRWRPRSPQNAPADWRTPLVVPAVALATAAVPRLGSEQYVRKPPLN